MEEEGYNRKRAAAPGSGGKEEELTSTSKIRAQAERLDNGGAGGAPDRHAVAAVTSPPPTNNNNAADVDAEDDAAADEELQRLTRRRARHATQSRRKREEIQLQIDALRQDCGRLNAANLRLWHHNKHLQNLIEKAETIIYEQDTARSTTETFDLSSTLLLAKSSFPINLGAVVLHGDQRGVGLQLQREVVALMQELECINQRISVLHQTSSLSSHNGPLQQQQQQVGPEATRVWQALLQEQQAHRIARQQQGNNTLNSDHQHLTAAPPPFARLQVATAAGGPSSVGAFQSSAPLPQQTWLQSSGQMQQQGPGAAAPRSALGARSLPSQYVTSGSVPLPSQTQRQLLPVPPDAGGSALMNHPPLPAAFPGYPGAATIPQPPVHHPTWPIMMGQVVPQLGLPSGGPTVLPPAATMWGQPPHHHQYVAGGLEPNTNTAAFFHPASEAAQQPELLPTGYIRQQQQFSFVGPTVSSALAPPDSDGPADAFVPTTAAVAEAHQPPPPVQQQLSPAQMQYILQMMSTGLYQHDPTPSPDPPGV